MRIYEIICENQNLPFGSFDIDPVYGGGKVVVTPKLNSSGKFDFLSYEFLDKNGKMVIKYEIKNNKQYWYNSINPNGNLLHENTSMGATIKSFLDIVAKTMFDFRCDNDANSSQKGNKMNENINPKDNFMPSIQHNLKPLIDFSQWALLNWGKVVELPAGNFLSENTAVNMSPFKDSINNSQSKKSKQAISKVDELTRKR